MAAINGRLAILKWGGNQITCTVTNSLNVEANMIDVTCKDDGGYSKFIPGDVTWTIDFEGVYDHTGTTGINQLFDDLIAGTSAAIYFGQTASGGTYWSGSGYISSITVDAPNNDKTSFSGSLQGSGTLTRATV